MTRQNYKKTKKSIWTNFKKECYIRNKTKCTFVSGSSIKNYLLKDPLIDWLKLYYNKKPINIINATNTLTTNSPTNILCELGYKFEDQVYKYLFQKYPASCINLANPNYDTNDFIKTKEAMIKKIPIICQATVYDKCSNIGGCADLIILGSWFSKLFNIKVDNPNIYYVIDIKWTGLGLCADGIHIRNYARVPSYKGQLLIYTYCVGVMQGIIPTKAYILAKSYKSSARGISNNLFNCFSKLGVIDYENYDNKYVAESSLAINWLRNVRKDGSTWDLYQDRRLLPNMKNKFDDGYHKAKHDIANTIGDVTLLWNVTTKNREIGFENGITSFRDERCCASILGIDTKHSKIIDKIIKVNKASCKNFILPTKLKCKDIAVDKKCAEFFIDFETLNSCFCYPQDIDLNDSKTSNMVVMAGVKYNSRGWKYRSFIAKSFSKIDEKNMFSEFVNCINKIAGRKKIKLFYWSATEKILFEKASREYMGLYDNWIKKVVWIDLCKIFTDYPIVVKGATSFGLKDIARNMFKLGLIKTTWLPNNMGCGLDALFAAGKIYGANTNVVVEMEGVAKYNEVDCSVLHEVLEAIRKLI
jgi:hypothetical protein